MLKPIPIHINVKSVSPLISPQGKTFSFRYRKQVEKASNMYTFKCQIYVSSDWSTRQNVFIQVQKAGREKCRHLNVKSVSPLVVHKAKRFHLGTESSQRKPVKCRHLNVKSVSLLYGPQGKTFPFRYRKQVEKANKMYTFKCQICVSSDCSKRQNVFIQVQKAGRESHHQAYHGHPLSCQGHPQGYKDHPRGYQTIPNTTKAISKAILRLPRP